MYIWWPQSWGKKEGKEGIELFKCINRMHSCELNKTPAAIIPHRSHIYALAYKL